MGSEMCIRDRSCRFCEALDRLPREEYLMDAGVEQTGDVSGHVRRNPDRQILRNYSEIIQQNIPILSVI